MPVGAAISPATSTASLRAGAAVLRGLSARAAAPSAPRRNPAGNRRHSR